MTTINDKVASLVRQLEEDLETQGWDQLSGLYVIEAVDDDPYLVKVMNFDSHPCDVLDAMPPLTKSTARGVVINYEAYSVEVDGGFVRNAYALLEEMGVPQMMRDEIVSYAIADIGEPVKRQRIECRFVQAMLRDGTSITAMRKRGETVNEVIDREESRGRLNTSLQRLICVEAVE